MRIVLTGDGVSFFMGRRQTLHRFETADGGVRYGYSLSGIDFIQLKRLFRAGFVEKLEVEARDVGECGGTLTDAFRLVLFSALRRKVALSALETVFSSTIVRKWNRSHPKTAVGPASRKNDAVFLDELPRKVDPVSTSARVSSAADRVVKSSPFNKASAGPFEFVRELAAGLDRLVLAVIACSDAAESEALVSVIAGSIAEAAARSEIVDLAALLGVELAAAAERTALLRAALLAYSDGDARGVLENGERRRTLMNSGDYRGVTIVISLPSWTPKEGSRLRLRISVYNDGADVAQERKLMEGFGERAFGIRGGRLIDSTAASASGLYGDDGLCFSYLGVLAETCRGNGVLLDSDIREAFPGGPAVTSLSFGF